MTEMAIGTWASVSLLGMVLACYLYMSGGRHRKWIRRFFASLVLALTVNLVSWKMGLWEPMMIWVWPALVGGFSMGYGAFDPWHKFVRRFIYVIGIVAAGSIMTLAIGGNAWMVWVLHAGVGLWSIWLGLKNPLHAAAEEVFVCATLNLGLCAYPFVR